MAIIGQNKNMNGIKKGATKLGGDYYNENEAIETTPTFQVPFGDPTNLFALTFTQIKYLNGTSNVSSHLQAVAPIVLVTQGQIPKSSPKCLTTFHSIEGNKTQGNSSLQII
jgi:hypothetical protein